MDWREYVREIRSFCSTKYAAIGWLDKSVSAAGPGNAISWICEKDEESVSRALEAFLAGKLPLTKLIHRVGNKRKDTGLGVGYLGLVPIDDDDQVQIAIFDIDRKSKEDPPVTREEVQLFADWVGAAELIAFWSKSGTGAHATVKFEKPFDKKLFIAFAKSWGFQIGGKSHRHPLLFRTEIFPKTEKKSMAWLPMEDEDPYFEGPRPHGLICGTTMDAATSSWTTVVSLPFTNGVELNKKFDNEEIGFLLGLERDEGQRNDLTNRTTFYLCVAGMEYVKAKGVIVNATRASGQLEDEQKKTLVTFNSAWNAGIAELKKKGIAVGEDERGNPQVARGDGKKPGKKKRAAKLYMEITKKIFKKPDKGFGNRFGRTGYCPGDLYYWDGGVYRDDGQNIVRGFTREILKKDDELDKEWSPALRNNVIEAIIDHESTINLSEPTHPGVMNLEDGLLDLTSGKLEYRPHSPSLPSLIQYPITYKLKGAAPEIWNTFLHDLFDHYGKDADRIVRLAKEIIADCMMPTLQGKKARQMAVLLLGPAEHGKSTFVEAVTGLIGKDNVSHLSLRQIEREKFALCQLFGKALNAHPDIGYSVMDTATYFKQIVSGDRMLVDQKNRDLLSFSPTCRLIFGSNRWPEYRDTDRSINRRWLPIHVELQKEPDDRDPKILEKLLAPEAKAGLLQDLIEAKIFERLLEGRSYRIPRVIQEEQRVKVGARSPWEIFQKFHVIIDPDEATPASILLETFNRWLVKREDDPITGDQLDRLVQKHMEAWRVDKKKLPMTHPHFPGALGYYRMRLRDPNAAELEEEFDS